MATIIEEFKDKLADIEHQRWSDWQKYIMLGCFKERGVHDDNMILEIPQRQWDNWHRQIMTPYKDLTEKEKDSDREQVDRYWKLITKRLEREYRRGLKDAQQPTIKHNRGGGLADLI